MTPLFYIRRTVGRALFYLGLRRTYPRARDYKPGDLILWRGQIAKYLHDTNMSYEGLILVGEIPWGGIDLRKTSLVCRASRAESDAVREAWPRH